MSLVTAAWHPTTIVNQTQIVPVRGCPTPSVTIVFPAPIQVRLTCTRTLMHFRLQTCQHARRQMGKAPAFNTHACFRHQINFYVDYSTQMNYTDCDTPPNNMLTLVLFNGTTKTETVKDGKMALLGSKPFPSYVLQGPLTSWGLRKQWKSHSCNSSQGWSYTGGHEFPFS